MQEKITQIPHKKTKAENIKSLYRSILNRVGKKGTTYENIKMLISKEDFINFVSKDPQYNRVYKMWVEQDFEPALSPSIDKIDNDKDYTLNNIQVLTRHANGKKGDKSLCQLKANQERRESKMKPFLKEKRNELIHRLKENGYNNQYISEMFGIDRSTVKRIPKPLSEEKYFKKLAKELKKMEDN